MDSGEDTLHDHEEHCLYHSHPLGLRRSSSSSSSRGFWDRRTVLQTYSQACLPVLLQLLPFFLFLALVLY